MYSLGCHQSRLWVCRAVPMGTRKLSSRASSVPSSYSPPHPLGYYRRYNDSEALSSRSGRAKEKQGEEEEKEEEGEEEGEEKGEGSEGIRPWKDWDLRHRNDYLNEEDEEGATELGKKVDHVPKTGPTDHQDLQEKSNKEKRMEFLQAMESYRIGTVVLPKELPERIMQLLKGYPRKWLKQDAEKLSQILRARTVEMIGQSTVRPDIHLNKATKDPLIQQTKRLVSQTTPVAPLAYDQRQTMAYLAHRVPGIYSCNYRVLSEIKTRYPDFQPSRVIDFGTGPGTAMWAARELWPQIRSMKLIEPSLAMTEVNKTLLEGFPVSLRMEYLTQAQEGKAELVIASYSLSELMDEASRTSTVRLLWNNVAKGGILCLIEPGTPIGFRVIRNARSLILDMSDTKGDTKYSPRILAPCTHSFQCPMGVNKPSWCHFVQRVQRVPFQFVAKDSSRASLNHENEKFSYIILSKGEPKLPTTQEAQPIGLSGVKASAKEKAKSTKVSTKKEAPPRRKWARLIRQPLKRGRHVVLDSCNSTGFLQRVVCGKSSGKVFYKSARRVMWGDLYDVNGLLGILEKRKHLPKRPWREIRSRWRKPKAEPLNATETSSSSPSE